VRAKIHCAQTGPGGLQARALGDDGLSPWAGRIRGVAQPMARAAEGDALIARHACGDGHGLVVTDRNRCRRPALLHGSAQLGEQRLLQGVHRLLGACDLSRERCGRCWRLGAGRASRGDQAYGGCGAKHDPAGAGHSILPGKSGSLAVVGRPRR
jgi:hypothetical protein